MPAALVPLFLSDLGETCDANVDGFAVEGWDKPLHLQFVCVLEAMIRLLEIQHCCLITALHTTTQQPRQLVTALTARVGALMSHHPGCGIARVGPCRTPTVHTVLSTLRRPCEAQRH